MITMKIYTIEQEEPIVIEDLQSYITTFGVSQKTKELESHLILSLNKTLPPNDPDYVDNTTLLPLWENIHYLEPSNMTRVLIYSDETNPILDLSNVIFVNNLYNNDIFKQYERIDINFREE